MSFINENGECSEHGNEGNPECKTCWDALYKLADKYNARIVTDENKK